MQLEIYRKKVKATNNKKSKEKALVSKKLLENKKKKCTKRKEKQTANENLRKSMDEVEEQK